MKHKKVFIMTCTSSDNMSAEEFNELARVIAAEAITSLNQASRRVEWQISAVSADKLVTNPCLPDSIQEALNSGDGSYRP